MRPCDTHLWVGCLHQMPPLSAYELCRKRGRKIASPGGDGWCHGNNVFQTQQDRDISHEFRKCGIKLMTYTGLHLIESQNWEKWTWVPIPIPKGISNWKPSTNEKLVFARESHWRNKSHFRVGCIPRDGQNKANSITSLDIFVSWLYQRFFFNTL